MTVRLRGRTDYELFSEALQVQHAFSEVRQVAAGLNSAQALQGEETIATDLPLKLATSCTLAILLTHFLILISRHPAQGQRPGLTVGPIWPILLFMAARAGAQS